MLVVKEIMKKMNEVGLTNLIGKLVGVDPLAYEVI